MTQPGQHRRHIGQHLPRGQRRPVNQDHWQVQRSRSDQLGLGTAAAGVLGNDMADLVLQQQGAICFGGEWAPRQNDGAIGQRIGHGRIYKAQKVVVLRFGCEGGKVLFADGQKHPRRGIGQGGQRAGCVADVHPVIVRAGNPGRAFKSHQRHACFAAGGDGIAAHLGCKGVRGINDMADVFAVQIRKQAFYPAKTTRAGGQGLPQRCFGAPGIGKHRVNTRICQGSGKLACLGGAAKQKDAGHA